MTTANLDALAGWVEILRAAKAERKILDEKISHARTRIEDALTDADADTGTVAGVTVVTWRLVESRRLDVTLAKALIPATMLAGCYTTSHARRFDLVGGDE
jgi:hypothetical protein